MIFRFNSGTADVFIADDCYLYALRRDDGIGLVAYPLTPIEGKYDMGRPVRNNGGYPDEVNEDFFKGLSPATKFADILTIMRDRAVMDAEDNLKLSDGYRFQSGTAEVYDDDDHNGFKRYLFAERADDNPEIMVSEYVDFGDGSYNVYDYDFTSQDWLNSLRKTTNVEKIKDILKIETRKDVEANLAYSAMKG